MSLSGLAEALEEYAELEGSELGETLTALIRLSRHESHINKPLAVALQIEMQDQLDWLKDNCTIEEEIVQPSTYKKRVLRFFNE